VDTIQIKERVFRIEEKLEHNEMTQIDSTKTETLACMQKKITSLELKMNDMEDKARRKNLQIRGIPESKTREKLVEYLIELFNQIGIQEEIRSANTEWVHRLIKPSGIAEAHPRDVIIRFAMYGVKQKIVEAARSLGPNDQRLKTLTFSRDMSCKTSQRRRSFKPALDRLKDK
ncbi:Hypothetical predicted protein, partial [Pelobates cultripes]